MKTRKIAKCGGPERLLDYFLSRRFLGSGGDSDWLMIE
jgi:hypothetical protein